MEAIHYLEKILQKKRVITKWLALPTRWMAPCKYLFSVKNSAILLCSVNHFLLTNFSVLFLSFGTNKRLQKKSLGRPHTPPRTVFQKFIFGSKNSSCWKCQKKSQFEFLCQNCQFLASKSFNQCVGYEFSVKSRFLGMKIQPLEGPTIKRILTQIFKVDFLQGFSQIEFLDKILIFWNSVPQ